MSDFAIVDSSKISAIKINHLEIEIYFPGGMFVVANHHDAPPGAAIVDVAEFDKLKQSLVKLFVDKSTVELRQ